MKLILAVAFVAAFAYTPWAAAQSSSESPHPDPALKQLDFLIGTWRTEGDVKASIFGPADKIRGTDRYEWAVGGFFQVVHHEEQHSTGKTMVLKIVGYDPEKKVYTGRSFSNAGGVGESQGMLTGDTWIWSASYDVNGETIKTRSVSKPISPRSIEWKWQIMRPGGEWTTVETGKSTKAD